jgi:SPP1 gp7 family putative phage head morphogenesis protein
MAPPEAEFELINAFTKTLMRDYGNALAFSASEAYLSGQFRASRLLRIPFSFHLVNLEAIARVANYKHDLITKGGSVIDGEFKPWLKDMAEEARNRVTQVVEEGIKNGTPLQQVKKALDEVFTMQEHKSQLVAYQETRRLFNEGTSDRFRDEGIEEFIWHHMDPQNDPRPEHQEWDGQVFTADSLPSLDEYNCHCWIEPVTGHRKEA